MSDKVERVIAYQFDGTIEGFNLFVDRMGDDPQAPYMHLDNKFNSTWKFTGTFIWIGNNCMYKKGDWYHCPVISSFKGIKNE